MQNLESQVSRKPSTTKPSTLEEYNQNSINFGNSVEIDRIKINKEIKVLSHFENYISLMSIDRDPSYIEYLRYSLNIGSGYNTQGGIIVKYPLVNIVQMTISEFTIPDPNYPLPNPIYSNLFNVDSVYISINEFNSQSYGISQGFRNYHFLSKATVLGNGRILIKPKNDKFVFNQPINDLNDTLTVGIFSELNRMIPLPLTIINGNPFNVTTGLVTTFTFNENNTYNLSNGDLIVVSNYNSQNYNNRGAINNPNGYNIAGLINNPLSFNIPVDTTGDIVNGTFKILIVKNLITIGMSFRTLTNVLTNSMTATF